MMILHYTGESVLVPNDVCNALLEYARALAEVRTSNVVTIPIITEEGEATTAEFLLGPASQLYATEAGDSPHDQGNDAAVSELARLTRRLRPTAMTSTDDPTEPMTEFDVDQS